MILLKSYISFIVPAFNEEHRLPGALIETLSYLKQCSEVEKSFSYEEWPEEVYPPYANGPGYVVSSDIAEFIVSEFDRHSLNLTSLVKELWGILSQGPMRLISELYLAGAQNWQCCTCSGKKGYGQLAGDGVMEPVPISEGSWIIT